MSCPFNEEGCFDDFPCILCVYDFCKRNNDIEECKALWKQFSQILSPPFKESEEKAFMSGNLVYGPSAKVGERESKPIGLPPTQKQLDYIQVLAFRSKTPIPKVNTLQEAKDAINKLLADTKDTATEKQVEYLRALALKKFGPNSEEWVQEKITKGKAAVSEAITLLRSA
jgi:hypothetical protein